MLAIDAQGLARGGDHANTGRVRQEIDHQVGDGLDEVFTVVHHEQHLAFSEVLHEQATIGLGRICPDRAGQGGSEVVAGLPR